MKVGLTHRALRRSRRRRYRIDFVRRRSSQSQARGQSGGRTAPRRHVARSVVVVSRRRRRRLSSSLCSARRVRCRRRSRATTPVACRLLYSAACSCVSTLQSAVNNSAPPATASACSGACQTSLQKGTVVCFTEDENKTHVSRRTDISSSFTRTAKCVLARQ